MKITRREFLKTAAVGGLGATLSGGASLLPEEALARSRFPYQHLAEPYEKLQPQYDFVVIGSGYGGSILAARLAEKGYSVCILERGREWAPGTFPEKMREIVAAARTGLNPSGLYDFLLFDQVAVVQGSGLGGTSLINGNVILRPEPAVFDDPAWPAEIRAARDSGSLEKYYDVVRQMLGAEQRPSAVTRPKKVEAMERLAAARGAKFFEPELAVNFSRYDKAPNHEGALQSLCVGCGNCIAGCNLAAKNTLNLNYLPRAKRFGAAIFAGIEVNHLRKRQDGSYDVMIGRRSGAPLKNIRARNVVVSAGSVGSTTILLRSREKGGLPLSPRLGSRFSGNGDVVGIAHNGDQSTNILGFRTDKRHPRPADRTGAFIMSAADYRGRAEDIVIEEGALPIGAVRAFRVAMALGVGPRSRAQFKRALHDLFDFTTRNDGAMNHSLFFLGMGLDDAGGIIELRHGQPHIRWETREPTPVFDRINGEMTAFARELNANITGLGDGSRRATVHPLGGCPMGTDGAHGVVDHLGRVFDPASGATAIHEGLYVADGSILPAPVGVNPLLAISAMAERVADAIPHRA